MTARLLCSLGAVACVFVAVLVLPAGAVSLPRTPVVDQVLLLALPGRTWDAVRSAGPALTHLIERSTLASLSVRGVGPRTDADDGYLMIGAGARAQARPGDTLPDAMAAARRQARHDDYGAMPGALGDALAAGGKRTAVIGGAAAALAAADGSGRVGDRRPWPVAGTDAATALSASAFVVAEVPADVPLADADADIARLLAAVDLRHALVLVAGPAPSGSRPQLSVFAADGPGFGARWARSATTRRDGYVTLPDIGVTVLTAFGLDVPSSMDGTAITAGGDRPDQPLGALVRANERAMYRDRAVGPVSVAFVLLTIAAGLAALAGTGEAASCPRNRYRIRGTSPANRNRFAGHVAHAVSLVVLAVPAVAFLSGLVAYDRLALGLYVIGVFVVAAALGALVRPLGRRRAAFVLVALTWSVLVADIVTGGYLQLDTVLGYSPIVAGRFQGFGNVAFALVAQAALVLATGWVLLRPARSTRAVVALATTIFAVTVVVDGAPPFGSDVGGVLAALPSFAVALAVLAGRRIGWRRALAIGAGAVGAVVILAAVDLARPADRRTHLGRFARRLLDGDAGPVLRRKLHANWHILTSSPWTLLVPIVVAGLAYLALRGRGPLARLVREQRSVRALLVGSLVLGSIGFGVNDSGVVVPALQLPILLPWLAVVVLHREPVWRR